MKQPMPVLLRADARVLPLADESVDLIVTSPPYFGLRSYQDGGEHYAKQLGSESSPREFIDALIECTREMVRVLKPTGSIFVNLGDKYSGAQAQNFGGVSRAGDSAKVWAQTDPKRTGIPNKSLMLLPERYRVRAVDDLSLIARAVLIWSKPNGLPESVRDRVRRAHEDWVHLTKEPKYFSSVDEIREPSNPANLRPQDVRGEQSPKDVARRSARHGTVGHPGKPLQFNPNGKLPGSVWEIASQPLKVPAELGVDHFAAFPMEWPRRLIQGWCPREICTVCGEGRRPVVVKSRDTYYGAGKWRSGRQQRDDGAATVGWAMDEKWSTTVAIDGYTCACANTSAPSTLGVVLDPFGGTGTTALVATMLGRTGISVDLSADYGRLSAWRCSDPKERARAAGTDASKVEAVSPQQSSLFGDAA